MSYFPANPRISAHQAPQGTSLALNDPLAHGYDDSDNIAGEGYFYGGEYDGGFTLPGFNPAIVAGNANQLDIAYGAPTRGTAGYPLHHHQYHGSQSMHHDHIGKNLQKIQQQPVDSYGVHTATGRGGNAHLMQSTTPPPMMLSAEN